MRNIPKMKILCQKSEVSWEISQTDGGFKFSGFRVNFLLLSWLLCALISDNIFLIFSSPRRFLRTKLDDFRGLAWLCIMYDIKIIQVKGKCFNSNILHCIVEMLEIMFLYFQVLHSLSWSTFSRFILVFLSGRWMFDRRRVMMCIFVSPSVGSPLVPREEEHITLTNQYNNRLKWSLIQLREEAG